MFKGSDIPRPTDYETAVVERDAWIETAAHYAINANYWRRRCQQLDLQMAAIARVVAESVIAKAESDIEKAELANAIVDLSIDLQRSMSARWNG